MSNRRTAMPIEREEGRRPGVSALEPPEDERGRAGRPAAGALLAPTPAPAARPYPDELSAPFRLTDGTWVTVRAIRPEDEGLLVAFHAGHSPRTIRMRFFGMVKALSRDLLVRLCQLDYDRDLALVAVRPGAAGAAQLLGVARYFSRPGTGVAEFAVVVGDAWQGRGLGAHLMRRLLDAARRRGVRRMVGQVLAENVPMLRLARALGFTLLPTDDAGVVGAEQRLA
jgi:acetyltransferase